MQKQATGGPMTMDDDWKGEHFIRNVKSEGIAECRRVMSMTWHKKRRAKGQHAPAADRHSEWARWAVFGQKRTPTGPVKI